jgi:hypothetical protein
VKLFHRTPEGCAYRKGVNWHKAPGWFRTVFFCGDCRLYFRVRWKVLNRWAPRVFLRWDLRKNEEGPTSYVLGPDGLDMVPATAENEAAAIQRLIDATRVPWCSSRKDD